MSLPLMTAPRRHSSSRALRDQNPSDDRLGIYTTLTDTIGDLPVRQVEAHEVKAQDPGPKRLVMAGQNGAGQIIEATLALLAPIALPMPLRVIMAVTSHRGAVTVRAADALGPPMPAYQLVAFRVDKQRRELHHE